MNISGTLESRKGYCVINGKRIAKGSTSFYWPKTKAKGVKVYYGVDKGWVANKKTVAKISRRMLRLSKEGVCIKPIKTVVVKLNLRTKDKKVKKNARGISVRTMKAAPKRLLPRFRRKLRTALKKTKTLAKKDFFKAENIMYDPIKKKLQLVDVT